MQHKKIKASVAWGNNSTADSTTKAMWGSVTAEKVLASIMPRPSEVEDNAFSTQSGQTLSVMHVNLVIAFNEGIKKDKKCFPDLTNDHKWETFKQKLIFNTKIQRAEDILNPDFMPADVEGQVLLEEQCKFMMSVSDKVL